MIKQELHYVDAVVVCDEILASALVTMGLKPLAAFKLPQSMSGEFYSVFPHRMKTLNAIQKIVANVVNIGAGELLENCIELDMHINDIIQSFCHEYGSQY